MKALAFALLCLLLSISNVTSKSTGRGNEEGNIEALKTDAHHQEPLPLYEYESDYDVDEFSDYDYEVYYSKQVTTDGNYDTDIKFTVEPINCDLAKEKGLCLIEICKLNEKEGQLSCGTVLKDPVDIDKTLSDIDVVNKLIKRKQEEKLVELSSSEESERKQVEFIADLIEATKGVNGKAVPTEGTNNKDRTFTIEPKHCELVSGKEMCLIEICKKNKKEEKSSCNIVLKDAVDIDKTLSDMNVVNILIEMERLELMRNGKSEMRNVESTVNVKRETENNQNDLEMTAKIAPAEKMAETEENPLLGGRSDGFKYESVSETCNHVNGETKCLMKVCKWNNETNEIDCQTSEKESSNSMKIGPIPFLYW